MFSKDSRLIDFFSMTNEVHHEKYRAAINRQPFESMHLVMDWLLQQIALMLQDWTRIQPDFNPGILPEALRITLGNGDEHYARVFIDADLVPTSHSTSDLKPFTYVVGKIYESIWSQNKIGDDNLIIYHEMRWHLESQLAALLSQQQCSFDLNDWKVLTDRFYGSSSFYQSFVDNLPASLIEQHEEDLQYIPSETDVLYQLDFIDKRGTTEQYNVNYIKLSQQLASASIWTYLDKLTRDAPYAPFNHELSLKQSLLSRLSVKSWVRWIDKLHWPITQTVALYPVKDLAVMEEFIGELVAAGAHLSTPFPQLLLIALKQYFQLIHEISRNLCSLCGEHHYFDVQVKQAIQERAQLQYQDWKGNGIKSSLTSTLNSTFSNAALLSPAFFRGLFDWVAAQDREPWLSHKCKEPLVLAIDELQAAFAEKFKGEPARKSSLLGAINADELDWGKTQLLFDLYLQDIGDDTLRKMILGKLLSYIHSDKFSWNIGLTYNNEALNQAYQLAYLLRKEPRPDEAIFPLLEKYKHWYEGWYYMRDQGHSLTKELYLLTCGAAMSYIYFDDGDQITGKRLLQRILGIVTGQYRLVTDHNRQQYLLPIRFILYIQLKFNPSEFLLLMDELLPKIDSVEDLLMMTSGWIETSASLSISLDNSLKTRILETISAEYWIIEGQLKSAPIHSPIKRYENIKSKIMEAFGPTTT